MNDERQDPLAKLIRLAGSRPRPDAERIARVRESVHGEWQRELRGRRRLRFAAMAAAIAAVLAGVLVVGPKRETIIAPSPLIQIVETLPSEVKVIDWNGATLRLEGNTRIRIEGPKTAALERGGLFFTSHGRSGVTIETPFGAVRDIGTQFEIRLLEDALEVRVREGVVDVRGTRIEAGVEAIATRTTIARRPMPITLEGQTLEAVLERAASAKGLRLEWRTVRRDAVLRGSVPLSADEAIEAATAAAGVSYRIEGDRLIVIGKE